jgi:hypothetical protein
MYACVNEIGRGFLEGGVPIQQRNRLSPRPTPYRRPANSRIPLDCQSRQV